MLFLFEGTKGSTIPSKSELIQWLDGTDGLTENDLLSVLTSEPVVANVNCLSFDGVDGWVEFEDGPVCPANYTISIWFYVADNTAADNWLWKYGSAACKITGSSITIWNNTSLAAKIFAVPTISNDTWHHVVATYDGTNNKLWFDGSYIGAQAQACTVTTAAIGRLGTYDGTSLFLDGGLSLFAVYDSAFDNTSAVALYNGTYPVDGRERLIPLQEGSGTVAYDASGNCHDGTISGGATWTTADGIPSWNALYGFKVATQQTPPYIPALTGPTKSMLTFDGVGDKLTKAGITGTDNYTCTGTATPTAGTNEITFTAGTVKTLLLDGVVVADFTDQYGKAVSSVDGYGITTTSGLATMWGARYADDYGVLVAADYNLLTNDGGFVHNGGEYTITQADFGIVDSIAISGTGTDVDDRPCVLYGTLNGKPTYVDTPTPDTSIEWTGTNWKVEEFDSGETWTHATATGTFPPKTGWPVGSLGSPAPTLAYDSTWIDSEKFDSLGYADLAAHVNGVDGVWLQWHGVHVRNTLKYAADYVPTVAEYYALVRWSERFTAAPGGHIEPVIDVDGEYMYDSNGEVIYTLP